jgi:hypothetical protein
MPDDILPLFPRDASDDVYEVVDPAEIDLVMTALGKLLGKVKSPTIKDLLETARQDIACLSDEERLDMPDVDDADEPRQAA